jgi:predicted metalloprotease with PDZ domain
MKGFFDAYVRRAGRIDVNRFLKSAGLEMGVASVKAKAPDGALRADTRVYAMRTGGESRLRVYLTHPMSGWLRAGLRNGDELVRVNGGTVVSEGEFNDLLNGLRVGNEVRLEVLRGGKLLRIGVNVEGYDWPEVKIRPVAGASERQRAIRERWEAGR